MHAEFFNEYLPVRKYDSTHFSPPLQVKPGNEKLNMLLGPHPYEL
jgi:hypothetical protein